jgi:hypothetical protein
MVMPLPSKQESRVRFPPPAPFVRLDFVKFDQTDPAAMSAQIAAARALEATEQVAWWWLSFADEDGFRGVAIVQARGVIGAVEEALRRNINPGGDVQGLRLRKAPPERSRNRLLDEGEAQAVATAIETDSSSA